MAVDTSTIPSIVTRMDSTLNRTNGSGKDPPPWRMACPRCGWCSGPCGGSSCWSAAWQQAAFLQDTVGSMRKATCRCIGDLSCQSVSKDLDGPGEVLDRYAVMSCRIVHQRDNSVDVVHVTHKATHCPSRENVGDKIGMGVGIDRKGEIAVLNIVRLAVQWHSWSCGNRGSHEGRESPCLGRVSYWPVCDAPAFVGSTAGLRWS